jgi:hypothetical protein
MWQERKIDNCKGRKSEVNTGKETKGDNNGIHCHGRKRKGKWKRDYKKIRSEDIKCDKQCRQEGNKQIESRRIKYNENCIR